MHTVETILISVISMLADPNDESPANVDAAVSILNVYLKIHESQCMLWFFLLLIIFTVHVFQVLSRISIIRTLFTWLFDYPNLFFVVQITNLQFM